MLDTVLREAYQCLLCCLGVARTEDRGNVVTLVYVGSP